MSDRRYDTPPKTKASLEQRLRNIVGDDALQLRARRQIGYIAVIAALNAHARDDEGQPVFAVKGGVAVELLIGQTARATKDLDAAVRARAEEVEPLLRDALARGWDGFAFRLVSWEPIRETAGWRGDVKVQFRGQPFSTVQFEAAPAEGAAGRVTRMVDNTLVDPAALGLSCVGEIPLVTLAYLIAQKLHACTDHSVPDRDNDRAATSSTSCSAAACWPRTSWATYDALASRSSACAASSRGHRRSSSHPTGRPSTRSNWLAKTPGFSQTDVTQAAADVNRPVDRIDDALPR